MANSLDSFNCRSTLTVDGKDYTYFSLTKAEQNGLKGISRLPYSMKVLLENLLRNEDGNSVKKADIEAIANWINDKGEAGYEIAYRPARVLMQDFTGVPAVVDLAAMRDAMVSLGGDPEKINPLVPVDLVIDHSVQVDSFALPEAFQINADIEFQRNQERYEFLRWGSKAFENFSVVPPERGICHQVNLEYLASVVTTLTVFVVIIVPLLGIAGIVVAQAIDISNSVTPWVQRQIGQPNELGRLLDRIPFMDALTPYRNQIVQKLGELDRN